MASNSDQPVPSMNELTQMLSQNLQVSQGRTPTEEAPHDAGVELNRSARVKQASQDRAPTEEAPHDAGVELNRSARVKQASQDRAPTEEAPHDAGVELNRSARVKQASQDRAPTEEAPHDAGVELNRSARVKQASQDRAPTEEAPHDAGVELNRSTRVNQVIQDYVQIEEAYHDTSITINESIQRDQSLKWNGAPSDWHDFWLRETGAPPVVWLSTHRFMGKTLPDFSNYPHPPKVPPETKVRYIFNLAKHPQLKLLHTVGYEMYYAGEKEHPTTLQVHYLFVNPKHRAYKADFFASKKEFLCANKDGEYLTYVDGKWYYKPRSENRKYVWVSVAIAEEEIRIDDPNSVRRRLGLPGTMKPFPIEE
uniref:Uncharacterized protein n=1 Tax=Plectus sambesii TaxID=2011161 RepID=A0A914WY83_9BILA